MGVKGLNPCIWFMVSWLRKIYSDCSDSPGCILHPSCWCWTTIFSRTFTFCYWRRIGDWKNWKPIIQFIRRRSKKIQPLKKIKRSLTIKNIGVSGHNVNQLHFEILVYGKSCGVGWWSPDWSWLPPGRWKMHSLFLNLKKQWYLMYNVVGVVKSSWCSVLF